MKHKNIAAMIASAGLLVMGLTCQMVWGQGQSGSAPAHVPGRILVKFKDGVSDGQARGLLAGRGALSTDVIPQIGVHIVQLPPNANEQAEANAFKGLKDVEFAEVDSVSLPQGLTAMTPNDAYYSGQWALPKIQANYAWSTTTGNSSIKIAVIDTGVTAVSDLTNKLVAGWNFYDSNSNATDVANHGTLVAGVAAPLTNNGIGVAGVCWGCTIMPLRVSDTNGQGYASLVASAITWAADNGAKVAIVGYPFTAVSSVQSAAQYFFSKGGVVLIPMGNSTTFDTTPMPLITGTSVPSMMAVGATDPNDQIYTWSTVGYDVALTAPGAVTTTTMTDGFYTTLAQGTSYSAAEVGGVAALMLSVNSCLSATQLTNILLQTAVDLGPAGWDATYGWGRVNANQAVMTASTTTCTGGGPPPVSVVKRFTTEGTVGTPFSYPINATNTPTRYGATGLPSGLTVNSTT